MDDLYRCLDCGLHTNVRSWRATRCEPADSTWSDGCEHCSGELDDEPIDTFDPDAARDWEMELDYR